jgi:DNA-binding beta-propeller fold protein YncE/tRNA A-37 threonylcarbamoyl transferase component Bud32
VTHTYYGIGDEQVLRTVGRYEIVREVGRGATARVSLARQVDLQRWVALKELDAVRAADSSFASRFVREARLAGSLNHPCIVTVHDYFEHDGVPFIAMEYFERGSLRPLVGTLSVAQVGGVVSGVLSGLAAAESRGIVHRDLKPENIMVTTAGGVKITDFGIAKALQSSPGDASITSAGSTVGTPAYMAPELALGRAVGPWTDLYALGVMTYELLAGQLPFDPAEMPIAIVLRHVRDEVVPLRTLRPELGPGLCAWVDSLLAKDARDRPQSALDAARGLDEALDEAAGPAWDREASLDGDDPGAIVRFRPETVTSATQGASTTRRGGRRRLLGTVGVLVVAAAAAAAYAVVELVGSGSDVQPPAAAPAPREPLQDLVPSRKDQVGVAVSGDSLFVADPRGRVVALDRTSLDERAIATDPSGPRSVVVDRGRVVVADGHTLTRLQPRTLAPRAAEALAGVGALAVDGGALVATLAGRRVCVLGASGKPACVHVSASPSGLGAGGGRVFVADADGGTVTVLRRKAARLVPAGAPIHVGTRPHGTPVAVGGRLYVPVERGVAIVDIDRRRVRRIALPVTPASLWVVRATRRLFAALPATGRVALVDTATERIVRTIPVHGRPVALVGPRASAHPSEVVVVGAGGRTVTRLDASTGRSLGSRRVSALGRSRPAPLVLRRAVVREDGNETTIRFGLTGGGLDRTGLVVGDGRPRDGHASLELWQGGIASTLAPLESSGVTVRVSTESGRLRLDLSTRPGRYASLVTSLVGRRTVIARLVLAPRPTAPSQGVTAPSGGSRPTTPGTKTSPPKKPPTKPKPASDGGSIIQF